MRAEVLSRWSAQNDPSILLVIVSIALMFTMEALRRRGERLRGISPG